jgi:hypothetical protein
MVLCITTCLLSPFHFTTPTCYACQHQFRVPSSFLIYLLSCLSCLYRARCVQTGCLCGYFLLLRSFIPLIYRIRVSGIGQSLFLILHMLFFWGGAPSLRFSPIDSLSYADLDPIYLVRNPPDNTQVYITSLFFFFFFFNIRFIVRRGGASCWTLHIVYATPLAPMPVSPLPPRPSSASDNVP